jgi:serine/threonine protein kinase
MPSAGALLTDHRRKLPQLLNDIGKLQVAAGEFEAAQQDFQNLATLAAEPNTKAEAFHNAYQAALEQAKWAEALSALKAAVALDPARFAPFSFTQHEPQRILGAGGFGVVFLCKHPHLGKPVVIKSLRASEMDRSVSDLFSEARALDELDHPAIIRLKDCGYADSAHTRPFLVMEYFDGVNLEDFVNNQGCLSGDEFLAIATKVADALQAAHAKGILHRDVKPANVLVKRENEGWKVKLIDFGLAVRPDSFAGKTSTQGPKAKTIVGKSIAGTMHYAAPEQMGRFPEIAVDKYSDVFGFGKTCYFALFQTPDPDDVEKDTLPEPWKKFLSACTAQKLAHRLPDFGAVLARLPELARVKVVVSIQEPEPAKSASAPSLSMARPGSPPPGVRLLYLKGRGITATGYESDREFVVLAGSQAATTTVASISDNLLKIRNDLASQKILTEGKGCLFLQENCAFASASAAASVMLGNNANGRAAWKDANGKTLKAIQNAVNDPEPENEKDAQDRFDLRKRFWEKLLNRKKMKDTRHADISASDSNAISAGSGIRGCPFVYVIGQDDSRVEMYIDRGTDQKEANKHIFDVLQAQKTEIEDTFGQPLSWQRLEDKRTCRIASSISTGGYRSDESKWPKIQGEMIDAMARLEKSLLPHLAKLKTESDSPSEPDAGVELGDVQSLVS